MLDRDETLGEFPIGDISEDDIIATLAATDLMDIFYNDFPGLDHWLGTAYWPASFNITEAADVTAFNGGIFGTGTLNATEGQDVAFFNLLDEWSAVFATTEAQDAANFDAEIIISTGELATFEAADFVLLSGSAEWTAVLAATESGDIAALSGSSEWAAILDTLEASDSAGFAVIAEWQGIFYTTEVQDSADFVGEITAEGILDGSETADELNFMGDGVSYIGMLDTTEIADLFSFVGDVIPPVSPISFGELDAIELSDIVGISGLVSELDRREKIIARTFEILNAVAGVQSIVRDRAELPDAKRPAILLVDNDDLRTRDRQIILTPEIYIALETRKPANILIGEDLNSFRGVVVRTIMTDDALISLVGTNGRIDYHGCVTDLGRGRDMDGTMGISLSFAYPLSVNELRR